MRQHRIQFWWWVVERLRVNARGQEISVELTKFPTWVVANFMPGDAGAFTEAHGRVDVIITTQTFGAKIFPF